MDHPNMASIDPNFNVSEAFLEFGTPFGCSEWITTNEFSRGEGL